MKQKPQNRVIPFLSNYTQHSRFAESYRTLRTNLQFAVMDKKFKTLLVSSAGAGEGKTSTVANLAYTMAQTGKRVLMLDADMRRPTLSKIIAGTASVGITGLLANFFGTMPDRGSLGQMGVGDLTRLINFQKKTGLLSLDSEKEELDVFFLEGAMADINWRTRPDAKGLLNILALEDVISPEQCELARNRQQDTGQRMEFIVANMGVVNEEVLKGALNMHVVEALQSLFAMEQGSFAFRELPESNLEFNIAALVDMEQLARQVTSSSEKNPFLKSKIKAAVQNIDDNLFLLASGPLPPNPTEMLGSSRMEFLLHYLQNMFDIIIIDSPPILPASDALLISPHTDGVLLVIKAGFLNRDMVRKAVEQLELAQANILGVVLNDVDVNKSGYASYYHKYYSGYYGEQNEKKGGGQEVRS